MTEIHEHTLKGLKESLPFMEILAGLMDGTGKDYSTEIRESADELRQNFPGLDDLTLAAFSVYIATIEAESAKEWGGIEAIGGAVAHAALALELAKSITDPA